MQPWLSWRLMSTPPLMQAFTRTMSGVPGSWHCMVEVRGGRRRGVCVREGVSLFFELER